MERCRGLTVVPHEDLVLAVANWVVAKSIYDKLYCQATKHADCRWKSLPFYERFYLKVKGGIFTPERWWVFYRGYLKDNEPDYQYKIRHYLDDYYNNKVEAAKSCRNHSSCAGLHYLNDEQALFVSIFKDLEIY